MLQTVEQVVAEYSRTSKKFQQEMRDPSKARAFLLRAGIIEKTKKTKSHPHGIRLTKGLR